MELFTIPAGNFKLDGGAMFGVVPRVIWQKNYPPDENNMCNLTMRCLLIVDGSRIVLVETGIGDKQDAKFFSYYYLNGDDSLLNSLQHKGFSPADITDVFLTHLHFDHAGGAVCWNRDRNDYEPVFINARYHIGRRQWDWALNPNRKEKPSFLNENFLPLVKSGQLQLIDEPSELFPDIHIRFFNGHTEGLMIPFIHYRNKTIVYVADFIPSSAHIPINYICGYDIRPLVTIQEKEEFYKEALTNNYILLFEHDCDVECCTICETEKGIRVKEKFSLKDI